MTKLKAIDLFAGAGGLSEGLRMAGIDVVLANDIDAWAAKTHEENHPETIFIHKDIKEVRETELIKNLATKGLTVNDIDIVAGGPPCQGFSIIGQRDPDDPRNVLFKEFVNVIKLVKPKVFIMENVFGILSMEKGKVKDEIVHSLENAAEMGYVVTEPKVLLAAEYGVPQLRRRVFFLGIRKDISLEPLTYPTPTHALQKVTSPDEKIIKKPYVTASQAIGNLPENVVESERSIPAPSLPYPSEKRTSYQKFIQGNATEIYSHHTKKLLGLRLQRINHLNEGDLQTVLPEELRAGGHENKYRRLHSKKPAPTLTAHMSKDLSDFIHYKYSRPITVREAARIQSFFDHYKFIGSEFQQLKQVGNAVPPLLGKAVGEAVLHQLKEKIKKNKKIEELIAFEELKQ
ncbi:DNA cytosine methyltransferase [Peribacillus sp. NPDC097206]|uniref:DNA cytosine methyltransferase n=1 Tax=Peribacillus sp. NPDC097206 TaxID=3364398 RepID=UPI00381EF8CC